MITRSIRLVTFASLALGVITAKLSLADEPVKQLVEKEQAPRPVVTLNENINYAGFDQAGRWGLTALELYRQAFLLAARDDFGLTTRDPLLGEIADRETAHRFAMEFTVANKLVSARLFRVPSNSRMDNKPITLKLPMEEGLDYPALTADALVRAGKEFNDVLRQAGLTPPTDKPAVGVTPVPPTISAGLTQMTFPIQYAAVRELHDIIRTKGSSPELLAALVRGYANLGILSELYFTSMHRAFKARSLLYADRLLEIAPGLAMAHRHKAYALALLGSPREALKQIELADAATKLERSKGPVTSIAALGTEWIEILGDYCRHRTDLLTEHAKRSGSERQLVALLTLRAQEYAGTRSQKLEAARTALRVSPECYRAVASMCSEGGVSVGHMATQLGPMILQGTFKRRVAQMPGLPTNVTDLVKSKNLGVLGALFGNGGAQNENDEPFIEAHVKLLGALRDAGKADAQELSWSVLAKLLGEELFFGVFSRSYFLRFQLSVPANDYIDVVRPLVADHPFVPIIDSLSEPPGGSPDAIRNHLKNTPMASPEPAALPLVRHLFQYGIRTQGEALWYRMLTNSDLVTSDMTRWVDDGHYDAYWTSVVARISVSDPVLAAARVRLDWKKVESEAENWERKEFAHSALVLGALGQKYYELQRWGDVQRCLRKALAIAKDRHNYERLAESYLKQGTEKEWLDTLEEYLQTAPDYGLDHASVRSNIADHFMETKEFQKALPYALGAAESWSSWGMQRAVNCYTGLEDWENAELWQRRIVERYPDCGNSLDWYVWCRMTGQGDVGSAKAFFEERLAELGHAPTFHELDQLLLFNMLDNQPKEALAVTQQMLVQTKTDNLCWYCAILSDELGDAKLRDSSLQDLIKIKDIDAEYAQATTNVLTQLQGSDKKFEPDPKMLADIKSNDVRSQLAFFIGYLLQTRKQNDLAQKFYEICVDLNVKNRWSHKIAVTRLREMASE